MYLNAQNEVVGELHLFGVTDTVDPLTTDNASPSGTVLF